MRPVDGAVEQIEEKINDLLEVIDRYDGEMRRELSTRDALDPVAELAAFQATRTARLRDLGDQMEEIARDMLDRVQNVDLADAGRFTGRPDDVGRR